MTSTTKGKIRRHPVISSIIGAVLALFVVIGIATHGSATPTATPSAGQSSHSATPAPSSAPVAAPTVNKIKFVIEGNVPASEFGEVNITYGDDHSTHNVTLPSLDGKTVYTMPFSHEPGDFYDVDATFDSAGSVTVKLVETGTGMKPKVIARNYAVGTGDNSGGDAMVSAAANDAAGTSWMNS